MLAVEAAARNRLGLFTAGDARACGVSRTLLTAHTRSGGRWARVHPRVYRVAAISQHTHQRHLAALLWAGPGAVLSHRAAGAVHGLDGMAGVAQVTPELWAAQAHQRDGVLGHRGVPDESEVIYRGPLRLTTLRRTVLDLADILDDEALELVVESALRQDPTCDLVPGPGCHGSRRLLRVLETRPAGCPPTESELETRYLQVIRRVPIPAPVRQHRVFDARGCCVGRLDLCWPDVGLWVELDGRSSHDRPTALLADRHRQNHVATMLRWLPLRFTWEDVTEHPAATVHLTQEGYQRQAEQAARTAPGA